MVNYRKFKVIEHPTYDCSGSLGKTSASQEMLKKLHLKLFAVSPFIPSQALVIGHEEDCLDLATALAKKACVSVKELGDKLVRCAMRESAYGIPAGTIIENLSDIRFVKEAGRFINPSDKEVKHIETVVLLNPGQMGERFLDDMMLMVTWPIDFMIWNQFGKHEEALTLRGEAVNANLTAEEMFGPMSEWPELPKPVPFVQETLARKCIHVLAGMFESYKSMFALELCSSVLDRRPAFDNFSIGTGDEDKDAWLDEVEILYLCFDMAPGMFKDYAANWGLDQNYRFLANHPKNCPAAIPLDTPQLREAVKGKILIVDTMLDVANIQEAGQSAEWIAFFKLVRSLINEHGCEAVILVVHPKKATEGKSEINPGDFLKDSVTFGGKADIAFALKPISGSSAVHVQRIKGRGFKDRTFTWSFAVREEGAEDGPSNIDRGRLPILTLPGERKKFGDHKGEEALAKKPEGYIATLKSCYEEGKTTRQTFDKMKEAGFEISQSSVGRYWKKLGSELDKVKRNLAMGLSLEELF